MHPSRFPLLLILIALTGCPSEEAAEPVTPAPAPAAPATAEPDPAAGLFASSVDEIVMKESAPALGSLTQGDGSIREPDDVREKRIAEKKTRAAPAPEATGGKTISAAQVKAVVKAKMPQVRACYEKELKKHDGLRGKVVMSWTIHGSGKVSGVRVVRNTTRNSTMVPCMIRAVAGWRFPKAQAPFDVEYPFVFKPRDY